MSTLYFGIEQRPLFLGHVSEPGVEKIPWAPQDCELQQQDYEMKKYSVANFRETFALNGPR